MQLVLVQHDFGPVRLPVGVTEHGIDLDWIAATHVDPPAAAHGARCQGSEVVPAQVVRSPIGNGEIGRRRAVLEGDALAAGDAGHGAAAAAPSRAHVGHGVERGGRHARAR